MREVFEARAQIEIDLACANVINKLKLNYQPEPVSTQREEYPYAQQNGVCGRGLFTFCG